MLWRWSYNLGIPGDVWGPKRLPQGWQAVGEGGALWELTPLRAGSALVQTLMAPWSTPGPHGGPQNPPIPPAHYSDLTLG